MFESIMNFFKKLGKGEKQKASSKDAAKERLHLVLMQDRANVSADFLDMMKQEIIEVIKKYIDVDEKSIDVRLTNKTNEDGTTGAPALYANIPIMSIKEEARVAKKTKTDSQQQEEKETENKEKKQEEKEENSKETKESKIESEEKKQEQEPSNSSKEKEIDKETPKKESEKEVTEQENREESKNEKKEESEDKVEDPSEKQDRVDTHA